MDAILVTGASTGIGAATARGLARRGVRVFATVRREEDGTRLAAGDPGIVPIVLDVTDDMGIARTAALLEERYPDDRLIGLVNNAGIAVPGPLEALTSADLSRQFAVNVIAPFAMARAFLPRLRAARGRIINVSSVAGRISFPFSGAYCASKFALEAASDAQRVELAPLGVGVVLVEPGAIATPFWASGERTGEQVFAAVAAPIADLYRARMARFAALAHASGERGIPPERVATAIIRALTVARPRARYLVGPDARLQALLALVPSALRDAGVRRLFADAPVARNTVS